MTEAQKAFNIRFGELELPEPEPVPALAPGARPLNRPRQLRRRSNSASSEVSDPPKLQ